MNTEDIMRVDRSDEILRDLGQYVDELANDEWHDKWEQWTARMDEVTEELHELLDIIAELEARSKMRKMAKSKKAIARIRNTRRMPSKDKS